MEMRFSCQSGINLRTAVAAFMAMLSVNAAFATGAVQMVVTNFVTSLDVPVVTNLVTITTTNTITQIVTNSVPSPEAVAIEERRMEDDARLRRIATRTFKLAHADAEEVAAKFNDTWSGGLGALKTFHLPVARSASGPARGASQLPDHVAP